VVDIIFNIVFTKWFAASAVIAVLGGLWWLSELPDRLRRARFQKRRVRDFDEWYEEYYAKEQISREIVRDVHGALAGDEIGKIDATQVLPEDRFDDELCIKGVFINEGADCFEIWLADYITEKGRRPEDFPWNCQTVRDVAAALQELLGQEKN
jgi:hypothetical protein